MQPTTKRTGAEAGVAAIALMMLSTGIASAQYMENPKTIYGPTVERTLTTPVDAALPGATIVWSPANVTTTTLRAKLGVLQLQTPDSNYTAAYSVKPCGGKNGYTVKIDGVETPLQLTIEGQGTEFSTNIATANRGLGANALLNIYADSAPLPGEYSTCIAVTTMADEGIPD
ncbi:hypothetical protein IG332_002687 [Salmonella enterica]|nr:hypothetical protein [Salmonella enterica]